MSATPRIGSESNVYTVVNASGLPGWAVCELDGLLGSGLVAADALDGMTTKELLAVAKESVRRSRSADVLAEVLTARAA